MYHKIVWCYIIILTLLDISLNTKLTAQGKSHGAGISVHDSLVEGITFSEWGKDPPHGGGGDEGGGSGARAPVRLEPATLVFGARALGSAHAATVTLHNTGNTTLHLASVAGTTPDFHASFFDSKTLPPDGNTTFSVVYLGRREGPVSAHLYIHTALGVHKYSVSAEGVASEYDVWPLLGLRVPANVSLQPVLTLRNPTARPIQVTEVYSSGGWVRLSLPGGGASADKGAWLIPPHSTRPIVQLSISAPPHTHTPTAYIRIKANITGGGIIVGVEARGAPAGEYTAPLQLRLRARGHRDPRDTFPISVGSSAGAGARLEAHVLGARCGTATHAHAHAPVNTNKHTHNGVKSEGASISLVRSHVDPYQELMHSAELTLDYEKLWAGYLSSSAETENGGASNGAGGASGAPGDDTGAAGGASGGAWCSGTVRLGRAAMPYSLRLLPGTLVLEPKEIEFITSDSEQASAEVELRARNEFLVPVHITHLHIPDEVSELFHVAGWRAQGRLVHPAATATLVKLQLKTHDPSLSLDVKLVVHTNVTDYIVPLSVYSGKLELEWDWPNSSDGNLEVGAVGTSSTRRVSLTARNPGARALCVTSARAATPGASLALHPHNTHPCIEAGGSITGVLTLVAPARPGPLVGSVSVCTAHATTTSTVSLSAHAGRIAAATLHLRDIAPYSWSSAPIIIESTMQLKMRVLGLWPPPPREFPSSLVYHPPEGEAAFIAAGRNTAGLVEFRPELLCEPNCYTGLDPTTSEGLSWLANSVLWATERAEALKKDMALLAKRQQLYQPTTHNISLYLRTDQVVQIPVSGWVRERWPRLVPGGAAWAGLAGVGGVATVRVTVRNPSHSHSLLLQPALGPPTTPPAVIWEGAESPVCTREACVNSVESFSLEAWRVVRGSALQLEKDDTSGQQEGDIDEEVERRATHQLPILKLEPAAEVEFKVSFTPKEPSAITAFLYLRNNLTIIEGLQLAGRGAYPSFELGGRRPGAVAPLVFEVSECGPHGSGGIVRRTVPLRNTGLVPIRVREWRIAGAPCANRGFSHRPCQPVSLQPNQSAPITLSFTPDYTLARVTATLELTTPRDTLVFHLQALTPPRVLSKCLPLAPRPPWEPALRAAGVLIAFALLILVLAAAALDAERLLRRARAARVASEPRAPLDLRAVAATPVAAPPPAPPRPPPPRRRKTRKVDPQAESRAFERWRAALRRQDDDESRSSEDAEPDAGHKDKESDETPLVESSYEPEPAAAISAYEPIVRECEQAARGSSGDDDAHSSGSSSESCKSEPRDRAGAAPAEHGGVDAEPAEASPARAAALAPPCEARPGRRREPDARRPERRADDQRVRPSGKHHLRKDKPSKRRERLPPAPLLAPPPPTEPRGGSGAAPVRWGASWSSVVARSSAPSPPPPPPPPAQPSQPSQPDHKPIVPDVRRRADDACSEVVAPRSPPSDNSLFYFNGGEAHLAEPEFTWRPRSDHRDFLDEPMATNVGNMGNAGLSNASVGGVGVGSVGSVGGVGVGSVGSSYGGMAPVWGSSLEARAPGAAWPWPSYNNNSGAVRPPPGFGTTPPGPVGSVGPVGAVGSAVGAVGGPGAIGSPPRGQPRAFDPFHSLAAIWSRNALDWRDRDAADDR